MPETLEQLFGSTEEGTVEGKGPLASLAAAYLLLDKEWDKLEEYRRDLSARRGQAQEALLNAMEQEKMKSFKFTKTGHQFVSVTKHYFALPNKDQVEERAAAIAWLRRVGGRDLLDVGIHQATLTKFMRERLDEGRPLSKLIKDTTLRSLSVRKE